MALGLLERQPGKSLRVALSDAVAAEFHEALGAAAAALPEVARSLAATVPASEAVVDEGPTAEATLNLRSDSAMLLHMQKEARHHLVILEPESSERRVPLPPGALNIGRAPPCVLLLDGAEISRAHCRIDVDGDEVTVTDLNSTNGTFVDNKRLSGSAPLPHGALLRIGNYVMTCEYLSELGRETVESTQRRRDLAEVTVLRPRRGRSG
jgi:pSer/pThr/pTyr-binding forkhead associated (FHA) protein